MYICRLTQYFILEKQEKIYKKMLFITLKQHLHQAVQKLFAVHKILNTMLYWLYGHHHLFHFQVTKLMRIYHYKNDQITMYTQQQHQNKQFFANLVFVTHILIMPLVVYR